MLEGAWQPRALGMLEFPTFEQAQAWYDSPEYAPLKAIRLANVRNDTILLDALADDQPRAAGPAFSDAERMSPPPRPRPGTTTRRRARTGASGRGGGRNSSRLEFTSVSDAHTCVSDGVPSWARVRHWRSAGCAQ